MRVKAVIAYDGSTFLGFQKQKSTKNTIQYVIEDALHSLQIVSGIIVAVVEPMPACMPVDK